MTDRVRPSNQAPGIDFQVARAIARGGGREGYVVDDDDPVLADEDIGDELDEGAMDEFDATVSPTSLDVTIEPGEAVVGGALLARDETTDVTLDADTDGQEVFVGWDRDSRDTVIVGKDAAFDTEDRQLKIWEFATDSDGVTETDDERPFGVSFLEGKATFPKGFAVHDGALANGENTAIGPDATALTANATAIVADATADGLQTLALGLNATSTGGAGFHPSTAVGPQTSATETAAFAAGAGATADSDDQGVLGVTTDEDGTSEWLVPGTFETEDSTELGDESVVTVDDVLKLVARETAPDNPDGDDVVIYNDAANEIVARQSDGTEDTIVNLS